MLTQFFESLYTCFGGLQVLQPIIPWNLTETLHIGSRTLTVLKQIGEGGYSFVYHVRDIETQEDYAVKKALLNEPDHIKLAEKEVQFMRHLCHPNLLPLLEASFETSDSNSVTTVYMLFPLYECGSLYEEVLKQAETNEHMPWKQTLNIFVQVCKGAVAMHSAEPPLAHRDIKPQNVLLRHRDYHASNKIAEEAEEEGPKDVLLERGERGNFHAVLMDFGSTREARVEINSRTEAVKLQEDAEAHCSAPYRAPELFDVPSHCVIDDKIDAWSLGCLLYFMMFAVSPFERVLGEAGGSLALAVANGQVTWPEGLKGEEDWLYDQLKKLVTMCLTVDMAQRPHAKEVLLLAQTFEQSL